MASLFNLMIADDVEALIKKASEGNATRPDFVPAMSEDQLRELIHGALSAHASRSSDFAAAYAWDAIWRALDVDVFQSTIVPLAKPSSDQGPA